MKKLGLRILGIAAIAVLAGCSQGKRDESKEGNAMNTQVQNLKFESYTYDYIGRYIGNDTVPEPGNSLIRFSGQGVLPEDLGDANIRALRDSLLKLASDEYVDSDSPRPVMPDSVVLTDLDPAATDACGEIMSTLAATLVTPRVVVWKSSVGTYQCMAAHGYTVTSFVNYSLSDGRIIGLKDLLKPGYEKQLVKLIRDKVKEMKVSLLCQLNEIEIPSQFEITTEGLSFSYDPYQIAPYSEGTVSVPVSTGDLIDLLSDNGMLILTGVPAEHD